MEKFGLDTSVVLRLLTGDPPAQAQSAFRFVQDLHARGEPAHLSDQTVSEAYFALQHHYGVPKKDALTQLLSFLESGWVREEPNGTAKKTLQAALSSAQKPGFVDRLIHAQYRRASCRLATFEKASKRLVGTVLLKWE
jgi:predicted nucleic acid-binding protein